MTYISWLYAKYGASVTLGYGIASVSRGDVVLHDKYNSPGRTYYHREDGVEVPGCTVDYQSTGRRGYYTKYCSRFGYPHGNYRLDDNGNPVAYFTYSLDGDGNATITGCNGYPGIVDILETIDGHMVVAIGNSAFNNKDYIRSVVIPDTVTYIGKYAFSNCGNLSDVKFSKSLKTMGGQVFACVII